MAKQRTGHLFYRTTKGWGARVTIEKEGETLQKVVDLETHDKAVAKKRLQRWHAEQASGNTITQLATATTREDTLEEYARSFVGLTATAKPLKARDRLSLLSNHIFASLGPLPLSKVTTVAIEDCLTSMVGKGLGLSSLRHARTLLGQIFRRAVKAGLIQKSPMETVDMPETPDEPRKERAILTDDEFVRFMSSNADLEIRMMSLVARELGGARTSDLIRWDWSHIDRVQFESAIVPRSKTNKPQTLAMPQAVSQALRTRWEAAGRPETGPIFPVQNGPRAGEQRATRGNSFARRLRRELLRAGIVRHTCLRPHDADPVTIRGGHLESCCSAMAKDPLYTETHTTLPVDFHSFRRAYNTALAVAGVNVQQAMHLAGHADPTVHARYVMSTPAMGRAPEAAIPQLPTGLFESARHHADSVVTVESIPEDSEESSTVSSPLLGTPRAIRTRDLRLRSAAVDNDTPSFRGISSDLPIASDPILGGPCRLRADSNAALAADMALSLVLKGLADRLAAQVQSM